MGYATMISELAFIREYNTFWQKLLPGADYYIKIINSVLIENIFTPLTIEEEPTRRVLTNNISFALFELLIKNEFSINEVKTFDFTSNYSIKLMNKEKAKLSSIRLESALTTELTQTEITIITELSARLYNYYKSKQNVIVHPLFKGCGILNAAEGDVFYNSTLSEVKAGQSKFKIKDLRQIYTYLALNFADKNNLKISEVELFNPRRGEYWQENLEELSNKLAACSTIQILNEIILYISDEYKSL
jgi:hypothetical protein